MTSLVAKASIQLVNHPIVIVICKSRSVSILQFWECINSFSCCGFRGLCIMASLINSYSIGWNSINKAASQKQTVLGSSGSYTVVLRWGVVMIMAFPQLQSQSLQSVQVVQPGHTFLNERHDPERDWDKNKRLRMSQPAWLIHQLIVN